MIPLDIWFFTPSVPYPKF